MLLLVFWGSGNFNTTARRITKTQPFALISSLSLHRWKSWYLNVCGPWCELEKAPLWKDVDSDSLREGNLCLNYGHNTRPDPLPLLMAHVRGTNYTALGRGPAFSTYESVRPSSWLTSRCLHPAATPISLFPLLLHMVSNLFFLLQPQLV